LEHHKLDFDSDEDDDSFIDGMMGSNDYSHDILNFDAKCQKINRNIPLGVVKEADNECSLPETSILR
jgi:hypothetical protein